MTQPSHPHDIITAASDLVVPGEIVVVARERAVEAFIDTDWPVERRVGSFYSSLPTSKYAGSMFTRLVTDPGQIEAGDLWATTLLSVKVPAQYGHRLLLDPEVRARTADLLSRIDPTVELGEINDETADAVIGMGLELYRHLRDQQVPGSGGWVMPAKLAARKRPHLLPVRDNMVFLYLEGKTMAQVQSRTVLRQAEADVWLMRFLIRDPEISERIDQVIQYAKAEPNVVDDSRLRVLDTVLWTHARRLSS